MSLEMRAMALAASALALSVTVPAGAQTVGTGEGWRYEATPYVWLSGVDGRSRLGSSPLLEANMTPAEVFEDLDFALMGAFEARLGAWGVALDGLHARLSDRGSATRLVQGVPVTVRGRVQVRQSLAAVSGLYRTIDGERPLDLEFGARWHRVSVRADLSATALGQLLLTADPSFGRSWWDPYVGLRGRTPLAPRWSLFGQADIGGFGLGSDLTWQVLAGVQYDISQRYSAKLGYRFLHVDYDHDGFRHETDTSGLFAGMAIRF
jgi:opacity protein-like surface antigen